MLAAFIAWSSAAAAIGYALLGAWQARGWREGGAGRWFTLAAAATSAWALMIAAEGPDGVPAFLAEAARNLLWLGFMLALLRSNARDERRPVLLAIVALLGVLVLARAGLALMLAPVLMGDGWRAAIGAIVHARLALGMAFAIGALILVNHIQSAALPEARWGIRLAMLGLAAMWAYDLNLATAGYLDARWYAPLVAARGLAMAALVPVFALAAWRNRGWRLGLSRTATFHSLSIAAVFAYLAAMAAAMQVLDAVGGEYVRLLEVLFVFGATLAAMLLLPLGRGRAWLKVKVAKHFFRHRYDYREEWLRFSDTLGGPARADGGDPLDVRAVKAIADITESHAGLLLLPDARSRLAPAARWCWSGEDAAAPAERAFGRHLEESARILELDLLRRRETDLLDEAALVPGWLIDDARAWAIVPLIHGERLEGAIVLARPSLDRSLDWEDFDVLRAAGRQVASHLAEARGQEALSDARRFDEFNRRFAFILHDVKNIVSQLSVLARNAERHADNPAFRADMVATLQGSVGKLNDLLARLSQHNTGRAEEPRPLSLRALARKVVAARHGGHPVEIGAGDATALGDAPRLEQALCHLVQNAVEASAPDRPVWIFPERDQGEARIAVLDHGCGMSSEFVRARLFKPFASTKENGFGIGAFEARQLVGAMGGRLEVESREGEGSRFTIVLPLAVEQADRRVPSQPARRRA